MKRALVGYTGFVGSNIAAGGVFDGLYNSKNIEQAYGTEPDLLIYAGLRAEKYLANNFPEKDYELILEAQENIRRIAPKRLVLISTVDVLGDTAGKDETCETKAETLAAYGRNRLLLEYWVREHYPEALIIRLPGLFGKNIKKNFIYDYINVIPFMLTEKKMEELGEASLFECYEHLDNGFYRVKALTDEKRELLKGTFRRLGFSALNFTDSRSRFQFYDLSNLAKDIEVCLEHGITLWHPATEPVSAGEVYAYLTGKAFENELSQTVADYDFRSRYAAVFARSADAEYVRDGYIEGKTQVLEKIRRFVQGDGYVL